MYLFIITFTKRTSKNDIELMYMYTHTHTQIYMYTHLNTYTPTHTYIYVYIHIYIISFPLARIKTKYLLSIMEDDQFLYQNMLQKDITLHIVERNCTY